MPRIARVVIPEYPHHITQRGNYKQNTFSESADYISYLKWLSTKRGQALFLDMKISVKVKAQAKQDKIEEKSKNSYTVWVKAKAVEGKANQAVAKVLSGYFDIAKSKIVLIKGKRTRDKIFVVDI